MNMMINTQQLPYSSFRYCFSWKTKHSGTIFTPSSITQTAKKKGKVFFAKSTDQVDPRSTTSCLVYKYILYIYMYIYTKLVRLVPVFSQFSQLIWLSFQAPAIWSFKMPKNSISKVAWKPWENIHDSARTTSAEVMLMAEIRRSPVEVVILSYYLQGFIHPRWLYGTLEPSTVPRLLGRSPVPQMTSKGHHLLRSCYDGGPPTNIPSKHQTSGGMTGCLEVILKIRKRQRISGTKAGSHNSSSVMSGEHFRIE